MHSSSRTAAAGTRPSYAQALAELGLETPIVSVEAADRRATLATAIRIGDPVHAAAVRDAGAQVLEADDAEIVRAWRDAGRGGGALLRAVVRGRSRRRPPRRRRGRPGRRHDHRARAQGPRGRRPPRTAPDARRPDPDAIAALRPRKRRGTPCRPRACDLGQPRPGVRLCGRRPRPVERARDHGRRRCRRRGRGRRRAPCRRDEPRRARVRAGRRPGREAVSLRQPDPAGARARLVGRGDRARPRRGARRMPTPRSCSRSGRTLEGHADNLAAALVGGVTLTWDGRIARIADVLPLMPVAIVPRERTSTEASRRSLPSTVTHADAAANAARAALLGGRGGERETRPSSQRASTTASTSRTGRRRCSRGRERSAAGRARGDAVRLGPDGDRLGRRRGAMRRRCSPGAFPAPTSSL